jgi:hypothetical protein
MSLLEPSATVRQINLIPVETDAVLVRQQQRRTLPCLACGCRTGFTNVNPAVRPIRLINEM